ncbi:MAG: putative NBD/HSP70 family sugar kinase [Limisphaerales bacterium]|jgi:predicted NBD/HSP70 family sugar kinase
MANDKDVKRAWLGVDLGGTKILAGVFDDGLSRLARSKTDAKASGGVGPDNVPGSLESIVSRSALTRQIQREVIVLGGGLMEQLEKRILPIIRAKALDYSDSGVNRGIRIVASSLADDAGIVGAAAFARRSSKG